MKSSIYPYIWSALAAAFLLGGIMLWHFSTTCGEDLEQASRQYGETLSLIDKYKNLRAITSPRKTEPAAGLFAEVNRIGTDLRLSRRIETLRPSGESGARENLDIQIRGLYLTEFLHFLQRIENLENVVVERMTLTRPANKLLDMEMRLTRGEDKK